MVAFELGVFYICRRSKGRRHLIFCRYRTNKFTLDENKPPKVFCALGLLNLSGVFFMSEKACCFIGHRNAEDTKELREKIRKTVEELINNEGVTYFLFGSRSNFNSICHDVVTELQEVYPNIKRIAYTCRHETATMKEDKAETERILSGLLKQPVHITDYDAEYQHPTKNISGKASYVERNTAMITDSDFCVFYYDESYLPPRRKYGSGFLSDYQPKSGTSVAFRFAKSKKKTVINCF